MSYVNSEFMNEALQDFMEDKSDDYVMTIKDWQDIKYAARKAEDEAREEELLKRAENSQYSPNKFPDWE